VFLACVGTIISVPSIFKNVLVGALIWVALTALVAAFPCLAPILGIWLIIGILAKVAEIIQNFGLLAFSFALYGALLFVPTYVRLKLESSVIDASHTNLYALLMFLMGALIMQATCQLFGKFGRRGSKTAAFIIGLPGFIIMLVIFLFNLHKGAAEAGGSGDGGGQ
jgi:hypothetical protein